ncbi:MAG TPA: DUF2269 family protein [Clostridia bacterium]|nr:DUF2269 family protein [Clostridia bacterium]
MYELIVYVHVLSAIAWVGGAFILNLLGTRISRSTNPDELPLFGRQVEWFGLRYFLPISIVTFAAGVILTAQRWEFSQIWISIAMLLWLVSVLLGALYVGPRSKKVAELFEAEGATSQVARAASARLFLVARIDVVIFLVIVALMVWKPGAGG